MVRRFLFAFLVGVLVFGLLGVWVKSEPKLMGVWFGLQPKIKGPFALPESAYKEPWSTQSGLRIATLRDRVPTVDRVVVVPDEATFLAAMQQWSLKGRWPILIEDERYTPMFIERFQPAEVIRLPAVKEPMPVGKKLQQAMLRAVAAAWDATDVKSVKEKWRQLGWEPPGVAIASLNDPAWPAAVALAADRGQPLVFMEGNYGLPNDSLAPDRWNILKTGVKKVVEGTGYRYAYLGDSIDTVTIVRQMAVKYRPTNEASANLAVTDGLARNEKGDRWAVVGWIYGDAPRAVYQAMCSIFIEQKNALFYDTYPKQGGWVEYEMNTAAVGLKKMGINFQVVQQPESTVESWRSLTDSEWEFDLVFVNSKGMKESFAAGNGDATVEDIPKLKFPAAVHFIHSWSATTPDDPNTIAGRWLENGAYAYVGSVQEPRLNAFVRPKEMVERLQNYTPFLVAARQLESPPKKDGKIGDPWRITTIGDPLMIINKPRLRILPSELPMPKL